MNRNCLGSQPFKYFVETDPTVPAYVKKITQDNIETWNLVLNKQDKLTAGKHIIIDNNEISFDHEIDEKQDYDYIKVKDTDIYNDLRLYYVTTNGKDFIPYNKIYPILDNTSYMQWQDGLYIRNNSIAEWSDLSGDYDSRYNYKAKADNLEGALNDENIIYSKLYLYNDDNKDDIWKEGLTFAREVLGANSICYIDNTVDNYNINDYRNNQLIHYLLSFNDQWDEEDIDYPSEDIVEFNVQNGERNNFFLFFINEKDLSNYVDIYIFSQTENNVYTKVLDDDLYNLTNEYYVYNRNIDTYTKITLESDSFKKRKNGLYVRTTIWDAETLLTAQNIEQLIYDFSETSYSRTWSNRYNNFIDNRLTDYVNNRINSLNLSNYPTKDYLNIKLNNLRNIIAENYIDNNEGERINEALSVKQNIISIAPMQMKYYDNNSGDNGTKIKFKDRKNNNEETVNGLKFENNKLSLALDILPDEDTNEIYKSKFNIEPGYNGSDFYNLLEFNYVSDKDTIYLTVPVATKIIDKTNVRAAVTVGALAKYLDGNFERKLLSFDSFVKLVDIESYKKTWGITGANWTTNDYKNLLKQWYDVTINWDDDNDQNIKNFYYDTHQRAIVTNTVTSNNIRVSEGYIKQEFNSEESFVNRNTNKVWYKLSNGNYVLITEGEEYSGNTEYYYLGDMTPSSQIPSCDAIARYTPVKLDILKEDNTNDYTFYLKNTIDEIIDSKELKLTDTFNSVADDINSVAHKIEIEVNSERYGEYTFKLKDAGGNDIDIATLNLPTERLVDHGEYDSVNNVIKLYFVGYEDNENIYTLTTDTQFDENKEYYEKSNDIYTLTTDTQFDENKEYYERKHNTNNDLKVFIPLTDVIENLNTKIDTTKQELEDEIVAAELETDNKTIKKYLKTDSNNFTLTEDVKFVSGKQYYELKDGIYVLSEDESKQANKNYYESNNVKNGKNTLYAVDGIIETEFTALGLKNGVGNITSGTVIPAGTTIIGLLKKMLVVPKDPTPYVPTVTLTTDSPVGTNTIQEVGTVVKPNMRYTFNQGSFIGTVAEFGTSYNQPADCEVDTVIYYNGSTVLNNYDKDEYTYELPEGTTTFKVNVSYTANTVTPIKNTGENSNVKINAGTAKAEKSVTAQYKYFIGYLDKTAVNTLTSADIRGLVYNDKFLKVNTTTSIDTIYKSNGYSIIIACPAKYKLNTITNGLGANIKSNFSNTGIVNITIGGESTCDYKVYIYPITNGAQVEFTGISFTTAATNEY